MNNKSTFTLTITVPGLSPTFMRDAPAGIQVIRPPISMQRSFDVQHVNVDIDIKLTIDLTAIASLAAAQWIIDRIRRSKIDLHPRINRKKLPPNDADAVKMIADTIDEEHQKDNPGK